MHFKRIAKSICCIGVFLAGAAEPALADPHSGALILADNDAVLGAWQQATGGEAEPQLVKQDDGGTRIEWHGGVTLNKYVDSVSGGSLLTPQTSGSYYKADIVSDLRATSPDGGTSFAQVSLTNTNDRSVLSQYPTQINSLVIGRAGSGYEVRLGDTALDLSRLAGSTAGVRGIQAQKQFGESAVVSVAAGVLAPSWEALESARFRTQYLRDAYAVKVEKTLGETARLFAIQEGYRDEPSSLNSANSLLAAASASVTIAGISYQKNGLSAAGEASTSRWNETGQAAHNSTAYALDVNWVQENYGLYGGYHDTGVYYMSLPGQAAPGLRETFAGGNLTAASWLALGLDLRRSENRVAGTTAGQNAVASTRTDTESTQANITFGPQLPGLSLALQQSASNARNSDGTRNRTTAYGANTMYAGQHWNAGVGYNLNRIDNPVSVGSSGKTETWTGNLGSSFSDGDGTTPPAWAASMNVLASLQRNATGSGASSMARSYTLQMHLQRERWIILDANYGEGVMTSPVAGGASVHTRTYSVSAAHPFGAQSSIRFYLNNNGTIAGAANQIYSEKQVGAELVYQL